IEASWKSLTPTEQEQTFKHLEELQKKDWKELSLDEKKAAYYVAFGPHGPREPIQADGGKTLMGVTAAVAVAGLIFYMVRKGGKETPATLTREWQEATDERLREQRSDPFTGVSAKNGAVRTTLPLLARISSHLISDSYGHAPQSQVAA
ncbi:cytochrome c oxidase subunit IV, partial [Rhodotorula sp. JG-1b]